MIPPPPSPLPPVINTTIDIHNQLFHLRRICNGLKASHAYRMQRCKLNRRHFKPVASAARGVKQHGCQCWLSPSSLDVAVSSRLLFIKALLFSICVPECSFLHFLFSYYASSNAEGGGVKVQSTVTLCVWSRPLCGVVVFLTCLPSCVLSVSSFWSTSTHTRPVSLKRARVLRLKRWVCVRLGEGTCAMMCFCIVAYKVIIYQMKNLCLF